MAAYSEALQYAEFLAKRYQTKTPDAPSPNVVGAVKNLMEDADADVAGEWTAPWMVEFLTKQGFPLSQADVAYIHSQF